MLAQVIAYSWLSGLGDGGAGSLGQLIRGASVYRHHVVEWLVVLVLALWCLARTGRLWHWLLAVVLFLFLTVQVTQFLSFYFTQQLLTRDAFQNAMHVGLLVSPFAVGVALLPMALVALVAVPASKARDLTVDTGTRFIASVGLVILGLLLSLPPNTTAISSPGSSDLPPVAALAQLLLSPSEPLWFELDDEELAVVRKLGFTINPSSPYPFIKDRIYETPSPFPRREAHAAPNLIVFFVESLSARKLSIYGSPYPGITPNIEDFAQNSMVVDNYFSHTAATYRGLRGQLCSMYPFYGGVGAWFDPGFEPPTTRLLGLPHLLNQAGYDTMLLGANTIELARMNIQAESVGFARSMLRNQINGDLLGDEPVHGPHLSDHQMMRALWTLLESRLVEEPFFLFMYNVGTHTNLDSRSDGVLYGDGAHNVLNTTHTFDDAFGQFWKLFSSSPLAENTVVVLTADHAHFPTPAFVDVAGPNYQKIFFDRIPLVIYHPHLMLPGRFDAGVRTSLGFAPSMAHFLELPNQRNPFLGRSIFEEARDGTKPGGLGEYGETLCLIDADGRMRVYSTRKELPGRPASMARFVELSQYAELNDRLWDGEPGH